MRLNYYRFPDGTSIERMLAAGCEATLKNGNRMYLDTWEKYNVHKDEIDSVDPVIGGLSVFAVKDLMKSDGGTGWTEHIDRDGGVFEVTPITLTGNNSRYKYNHHL